MPFGSCPLQLSLEHALGGGGRLSGHRRATRIERCAMDELDQKRLVWRVHQLLSSLRVFEYALYSFRDSSPTGLDLVIRQTATIFEERQISVEEVDKRDRLFASECLRARRTTIYDRENAPKNEGDERWWNFVMANGPVRKAGLVLCCQIAAKDEVTVREAIGKIQAEFKGKTWAGSSSRFWHFW